MTCVIPQVTPENKPERLLRTLLKAVSFCIGSRSERVNLRSSLTANVGVKGKVMHTV